MPDKTKVEEVKEALIKELDEFDKLVCHGKGVDQHQHHIDIVKIVEKYFELTKVVK